MVGIISSRKISKLKDYAVGGRSYSAGFIFATLSASFIGGGFTLGLAEKTMFMGGLYVVALWGFSCKEILVAKYIVPKMTAFKDALSVGDIMQRLYGRRAGIFTGIAGMLVSAGVAGAQFSGFGYIVNLLTGIPQSTMIVVSACIVMTYSTLGGMRAVVANDLLHFIVLIVALPMVCFLGIDAVGGWSALFQAIPSDHIQINNTLTVWTLAGLFLSFFFGETLVPPYVQRLLIGKNMNETARGTMWSGLLSFPFFAMVGIIGLVALVLAPNLNPSLALPHVIQTVMPVGLKGLAIAGMMAVVMSSADAFLNAAAVTFTHDVVRPLYSLSESKEVMLTRIATVFGGVLGMVFAVSSKSVLEILLIAYNFWTPMILVPLVSGIMGYTTTARTFWISASAGIGSMALAMTFIDQQGRFDAALAGIAANFLVFFLLRRQEKQETSDSTLFSKTETSTQQSIHIPQKRTGTNG